MSKRSPSLSSAQPDPTLLEELALMQRVCLALALVVGGVILSGWLIPAIGHLLPAGWTLMKANTALLTLLSACSLACSQPRRSRRTLGISRLLALVVAAVALTVLLEYVFHLHPVLDTLLAADKLSPQPGRMSPQTAGVFALLSVVMVMIRARKGVKSRVADTFLFCLCLLILVVLSGYTFGALRMFGPSMSNRTSPQTLLAMMLLAFVAFARRAEYGSFGILLGTGMGGRIARIATPFALALPFALEAGSIFLVHSDAMDLRYAAAIVASMASMLTLGLVVVLARLIEQQEREIRDLSLRDGLTELYNRRGFYLLAEQALRLSQRAGSSFSVLFIDLDNLKSINDSLGHEAGSAFLSEVSELLRKTFHRAEILGRIGGDEFVVASEAGQQELDRTAALLEAAARQRNALPGRTFPFSFSVGYATSDVTQHQTLEDLLASADKSMYQAKLRNKLQLAG